MDFERIVTILVQLLEDQEDAKIPYRIIPLSEEKKQKMESTGIK